MKCTEHLVNCVLKNKMSNRKKTKILKRSTSQKERICRLCGQLYLKYKDFVWNLDDESYFIPTSSEINNHFYSRNVELTPNEIKYKTEDKFEDKLVVYPRISRPHITPSEIAINGNT